MHDEDVWGRARGGIVCGRDNDGTRRTKRASKFALSDSARWGMVSEGAREERKRLLRRRWKRLMRALRGNTPPSATATSRKFATGLSVVFWNAQSLAAKAAKQGRKMDASVAKWEWLRAQYAKGERPTVIVLAEVEGTLGEMRKGLQGWARALQYEPRFLPGEGGSRREQAGTLSNKNGLVMLVAKEQAKAVRHVRVEERVLGLVFRIVGEGRLRAICGLHGLSADGSSDFGKQLGAAEDWLQSQGGGVLVGDFNRVPCSAFRKGEHGLTQDDLALRKLTRFRCGCCQAPCEEGVQRLIGMGAAEKWLDGWTRFEAGVGTSCIDFGVAIGLREEGRWSETERFRPAGPDGELSDHVALRLHRAVVFASPVVLQQRPRGVNFSKGKEGALVLDAFRTAVRELQWKVELGRCVDEAQGSKVQVLASMIVQAAWRAVASVKLEKRKRAAAAAEAQRGRESARGLHNSWCRRLRAAVGYRDSGIPPWDCKDQLLFHTATGLRRLRCKGGLSWNSIVRACRRQVARAGRILAERLRADDRTLETEMARNVEWNEDAAVKLQRAWRALRVRGASLELDCVREGDCEVGKQIFADDDPVLFAQTLRDIGQKFVTDIDGGACPRAFAAWCDKFMEPFPPLDGIDDGAWLLSSELTIELFLEILQRMPKGKAVGAGGLALEMLKATDDDIKVMFYDAMMADLSNECPSEDWRHILYVLLVKPAPNNPELVNQRREIGLGPQDLKLCLQMVRRAAYMRLDGRVHKAQMGGVSGYGASDPGLTMEVLVQQCKRLQLDMWVLYVDLKTWYPKLNRDCCTFAQVVHGLPYQVRRLVSLIYGKHGDYDAAVKCRYDSSVGLSEPFHNFMGRLMGCVLSPDEAKLVLNTVVVAIAMVARGIRLWGTCSDGVWRRVLQLCYVDDWAGAFENCSQLRKAWKAWRVWEPLAGAAIGVKKKLKTVVSGVRHVGGKCISASDPKLEMLDGSIVPFLECDEAYKYLGRMSRLDGRIADAKGKLNSKLEVAFRRLRRMHRPSRDAFMICSEGLVNSLVAYYMGTTYISWEEAEKWEAKWRRIFNMKFERARSSPRVELYVQVDGQSRVKTHLWVEALAALFANSMKALADVDDTEQRAAVRSALGLAAERAGCRSDFNRWDVAHLAEPLERKLRLEKSRHVGDGLLCVLALTTTARQEVVQHRHLTDEEAKDRLREERAWEKHGRFDGSWRFAPGDALCSVAPHFTSPESRLLFEPAEGGGLGLPPELGLMEAGVVAEGHLTEAVPGGGFAFLNWKEARARISRLQARDASAWERVVRELEDRGCGAVRPERIGAMDEHCARGRSLGQWFQEGPEAESGGAAVNAQAVEGTIEAIRAEMTRPAEERKPRREWEAAFDRCFPGAGRQEAREWRCGRAEPVSRARGARVVWVVDRERNTHVDGGEARFLRRREASFSPSGGDGNTFRVGEDGWAEGWKQQSLAALESIEWDEMGFAIEPGVGLRLDEQDCAGLDVGLQALVRARLRAGDGVRVRKHYAGKLPSKGSDGKPPPQTVCLEVQHQNVQEICMWAARVAATAVFATDGSYGATDKEGSHGGEPKASRACVRHDGRVYGGVLPLADGVDNYIAEVEALIEALASESDGGRIIIMMDATSPVTAWARFHLCHARRKLQFREHARLDALDQQIARHEAVVFLWQESHVGSPLNDWADAMADAAREQDIVGVFNTAPSHFSATLAAPRGGVLRWAKGLLGMHVEARLRSSTQHTELAEGGELVVGLRREDEILAAQVRSSRRALADPKRLSGMALQRAVEAGCPAGCRLAGKPVACTWTHTQLFCGAPSVVAARSTWLSKVQACHAQAEKVFSAKGIKYAGGFHDELDRVKQSVRKAVRESPKGGRAAWQGGERTLTRADLDREDDDDLRVLSAVARVTGNLVATTGDKHRDRDVEVLKAVKEMVEAGLHVQREGDAVGREVREKLSSENKSLARVRKFAAHWRKRVLVGGPSRVEELRRWHAAWEGVKRAIQKAKEAKGIASAQAKHMLARLRGELVRSTAEARGKAVAAGGAQGWQMAAAWQRWRLRMRKWRGAWDAEAERLLDSTLAGTSSGSARGWVRHETEQALMNPMVAEERTVAAVGRATRALAELGGGKRAWQLRKEAERKQRREAAEAEQKRQAEALASAIAHGTCSGEPQQPVGVQIVIDRTRIRGERATASRKRARRAASAAAVAQLRKGEGPDDSGNWAVRRIVEVIRFKGRGRRIDVKVQWEGVDKRGRPWADSWVRIGKLSDDLKKEVWQRLEAEEARGRHKGVRTRGWRACARLQATRARLESDSESESESESEPSEYDSEDDMSLRELLLRDEGKREEKLRERMRAAARAKEIEAAEAEEAARGAAEAPRRTRGGARF